MRHTPHTADPMTSHGYGYVIGLPGEWEAWEARAARAAHTRREASASRSERLRRRVRLITRVRRTTAHTASERLTYTSRYGLRCLISERVAARIAEQDALRAEQDASGDEYRDRRGSGTRLHAALSSRADRARARYLASLSDAERAALESLTPDEAQTITEAYDAAQAELSGYDASPWRGMVAARETRVSPRGASEQGKRGTASRVSIRDAHAATASDEHGLAATTVKPLRLAANDDPTMVQRTLTLTARLALESVPQSERLAWFASLPASAWHTATVPVPERPDAAERPARAEHPAHAAARADEQADRVRLLTSVATYGDAELSA